MSGPVPSSPPRSPDRARPVTDGDDFRNHIPTVDDSGKRVWVYPRKPRGRFYTARGVLSLFLLAFLVAGPWLKIQGNPVLMMNIVERRFAILGQIFWPQDMFIFVLMLLIVFVMVVLSSAVYGRIWCGWLCPQTVLMELVFRKVEYWIEGDAHAQRKLRTAPWSAGKFSRKLLKHSVFLVLSFGVGNLLLGYIIGGDALVDLVRDDPRSHLEGLTAMLLFTGLFYGIFARFREQACTFICPYGRFQSGLLDNDSIVVAYDFCRGEKRGRRKRGESPEDRATRGAGDCIDCGMCVDVCPTGIDIRNGTQMECVNCTACIDACDGVMDRMKFSRGLIRYASQNQIEQGRTGLHLTPRLYLYSALLLGLGGLLSVLLLSRTEVEASLLRSPGTLYQEAADGDYINLYLVKVVNKTPDDIPVDFRLVRPPGRVTVPGGLLQAKARDLTSGAVVVQLPPEALSGTSTPVEIGVYQGDRLIQTVHSTFMGPASAGSGGRR